MAKSPKTSAPSNAFEEAPQASFEGAPLSGSVSDWVKQLEAEAEASTVESQRELASKAGKHRKKIEVEARRHAEKVALEKATAKPTAKNTTASKTSRGVSIGASSDPKTRAAAGLNPIAGMDVSLEEAESLAPGAVTATVDALSKLIESGNPLFKNGELWMPHRPARPAKSEGGVTIRMASDFEPAGDQPTAIKDLVEGLKNDDRTQVLLGVTGSGKTFTMAKVIEATQRPAVILAPNKTLAAQLYSEFKNFFPDNAVEYFVSYYDYYQPEAYVPRTDTYIEKESTINEQIDRMRHAATRAILERDDVHHRRLRLLHLRHRLGRNLHGHDLPDVGSATASTSASCSPTSWPCNTSATTSISSAAPSACAATPSNSSPPTWRMPPGASPCSATRSRASPNSTR